MARRPLNLPSPPKGIDRNLQQYLQKVGEYIEQGEAVRGDPLYSNVKWKDMVDGGFAKLVGGIGSGLLPGQNLLPTSGAPNLTIPPAPVDFEVTGGFAAVYLTWGNPLDLYNNHSYTEIWRGTENNLANAALIGQVHTSFIYADFGVEQNANYYYWIRFVSDGNVSGPYNSSNGEEGSRSIDPAEILAVISGEIHESDLAIELQTKINTDGNGAYVEENQEAIDGVLAQWTVKTQVNDLVGGVGFYNDGNQTQFLINASTFAVLGQGENSVTPFVVQNGSVYMDTVLIRDGTLSSAKIGSLAVDKLVGNTASWVSLNTADGSITNAKIGNEIQSHNFFIGPNGQSRGWELHKDSGIRAVDLTIYDYDGNVILQGGGGLTAAGIKPGLGGSGVNVMPAPYSMFGSPDIENYTFWKSSTVDVLEVYSGTQTVAATPRYGTSCLRFHKEAGDQGYVYLGGTDAQNIKITPYKKWIVSAYVRNTAESGASGDFYLRLSDGTTNVRGAFTYGDSGVFTRVSAVIDLSTYSSREVTLRIDNNSAADSWVYVDAIQIEEQIGSQTEPSAYSAPSLLESETVSSYNPIDSANIDVYMRTVSIDTLYLNGRAVVLPYYKRRTDIVSPSIAATELHNMLYDEESAPVTILANVIIYNTSGSDDGVNFFLAYQSYDAGGNYINGGTLESWPSINTKADSNRTSIALMLHDTPTHTAGGYTRYYLRFSCADDLARHEYSTMLLLKSMNRG